MSGKHLSNPSKQELIARMNDGLAQLLAFIDQFSEDQMLEPKDAVGWNGRDHLTHMAVWADGIAALLHRKNRWAAMGLALENPDYSELDFDALNEQIVVQYRHLSLTGAKDWLVKAHEKVLAAVTSMSEAELVLTYDRFVAPFTSDGGSPVWSYVAGNTFGHYLEHQFWIGEIIEQAL